MRLSKSEYFQITVFSQKSTFLSKITIFSIKSPFLSKKSQFLVKNHHFLSKVTIFNTKSQFWGKITILVQNNVFFDKKAFLTQIRIFKFWAEIRNFGAKTNLFNLKFVNFYPKFESFECFRNFLLFFDQNSGVFFRK